MPMLQRYSGQEILSLINALVSEDIRLQSAGLGDPGPSCLVNLCYQLANITNGYAGEVGGLPLCRCILPMYRQVVSQKICNALRESVNNQSSNKMGDWLGLPRASALPLCATTA